MTNEPTLIARIRARRIFQWTFAYVAGAWVLLELVDFLSELYGWPEVVVRFLLTAFGFGLLATLVVSWFHGAPGRQRAPRVEVALLVLVALVGTGASLRVLTGVGGGERAGVTTTMGLTRAALAETRIPDPRDASLALAVLPFASLDESTFADGVMEDVLHELSLLPGLRVISRTTSMRYRDSPLSLVEIGRELNVDLVLEGSVRQVGDRTRIVVQLIDARTDEHLWAGSYDREITDLLAVQAEVADEVAAALSRTLGLVSDAEPVRRASRLSDVDPEAYRSFLEGRRLARSDDPAEVESGAALLTRAVTLDPRIDPAWRAMGDLMERTGGTADTALSRVHSRVRIFAQEQLERDGGVAESTRPGPFEVVDPAPGGWRMVVHVGGDDLERLSAAESALVQALATNPNDADARRWYGLLLARTGRPEVGLEQLRIAEVLDPASLRVAVAKGTVLEALGRTAEARSTLERVMLLLPDQPHGERDVALALAQLHALLGDTAQAVAWGRRARDGVEPGALTPDALPVIPPLPGAGAGAGRGGG